MTWTELNRRKMPNLRAREGASAKLMVMLQSWARRKYDVQSYTFTLPKQMLPTTDKLLKKTRRLKPLKTKRAGLGKELQGQYNPIRAGSAGELRSLAALEQSNQVEKKINDFNDTLISAMSIFPEDDGLDTARDKIEEGKEIERKKRIERRSTHRMIC